MKRSDSYKSQTLRWQMVFGRLTELVLSLLAGISTIAIIAHQVTTSTALRLCFFYLGVALILYIPDEW